MIDGDEDYVRACVQAVQEMIPAVKSPSGPMTDSEAIEWEKNHIDFGMHNGKQISEVPLEYLLWLDSHAGGFHRQLTRYLQSPRMQREQD